MSSTEKRHTKRPIDRGEDFPRCPHDNKFCLTAGACADGCIDLRFPPAPDGGDDRG